MKIEYKTSVLTPAGHRTVYIVALAERVSEKRCKVTQVLTIDGEEPQRHMSRTGANRQVYNGEYVAEREPGKVKNISTLYNRSK